MKTSKGTPFTKLIPIHPVRSQKKVDDLVENFNEDWATPILIGYNDELLNGTHRYRAYLLRKNKGYTDNFSFAYYEDIDTNDDMGAELKKLVDSLDPSDEADNTDIYVDIDHYWNDNWDFISTINDVSLQHY